MSPLSSVSVVIPCRNGGSWLPHAISSALAATGASEVIVADDGSTDGSLEVARSFGGAVTVLALGGGNGNVARNRGLAVARGEWIQFLDADDYLEPHKIEAQLLEAHP